MSEAKRIVEALERTKCPHTEADYSGIDCAYCIENALATLTREREEARTALAEAREVLKEARAMLSEAAGIAAGYYSDDQVGCLCMGECYCRAGQAQDFGSKHDTLAARIDTLAGEGGA